MTHFLIIDSNEVDAKLAEGILARELGYSSTIYASAEEALRHCRGLESLPDGVLIDLAEVPAFLDEFKRLAAVRNPRHFCRSVAWADRSQWRELTRLHHAGKISRETWKPTKGGGEVEEISPSLASKLLKQKCDLTEREYHAMGPAGDDPPPWRDPTLKV